MQAGHPRHRYLHRFDATRATMSLVSSTNHAGRNEPRADALRSCSPWREKRVSEMRAFPNTRFCALLNG
jgi:hypothetical protein